MFNSVKNRTQKYKEVCKELPPTNKHLEVFMYDDKSRRNCSGKAKSLDGNFDGLGISVGNGFVMYRTRYQSIAKGNNPFWKKCDYDWTGKVFLNDPPEKGSWKEINCSFSPVRGIWEYIKNSLFKISCVNRTKDGYIIKYF